MRDDASRLVRRLWQYCSVLRDDGLSYPDYVEQLTYLLFLKMSDEQHGALVPEKYSWKTFLNKDALSTHRHYTRALTALGKRGGMLGLIFRDARNKIRDPGKLRLLIVDLIGQSDWTGASADVKGDAYEGLLEKNARDTKSGAGQYFTPRPLIDAMVACVNPIAGEVICDPACGTAGFLLAAQRHVMGSGRLSASQKRHLARKALRGVELVPEVARLAAMNLLLHGVDGPSDSELPIACADSLIERPKRHVDVVLTNPPFGTKGSVTYSHEDGSTGEGDDLRIVRRDFWVQTANKQLNFIQHVVALLKPGGRAAVVIPDNVLFESGAAAVVRRHLLQYCKLHTILRLPTGLFYAQGVQANVMFFDKRHAEKPSRSAESLWVYDLRAGNRFSLKTRPLASTDLEEFVTLYRERSTKGGRRPESAGARWRSFEVAELLKDERANLDLAWSDDAHYEAIGGHDRLNAISEAIAADLRHAMDQIAKIVPTSR